MTSKYLRIENTRSIRWKRELKRSEGARLKGSWKRGRPTEKRKFETQKHLVFECSWLMYWFCVYLSSVCRPPRETGNLCAKKILRGGKSLSAIQLFCIHDISKKCFHYIDTGVEQPVRYEIASLVLLTSWSQLSGLRNGLLLSDYGFLFLEPMQSMTSDRFGSLSASHWATTSSWRGYDWNVLFM